MGCSSTLCTLAVLFVVCCGVWAEEAKKKKAEKPKEPTPLVGPKSPNVVELTDENFEGLVKNSEVNWFIHFYATFCGDPCIKADEELDKLADKYPLQLKVGRMAHNQLTLRRFNIVTYPTVVYVRRNYFFVFDGDMEFEKLEKFAAEEYKLNKEYTIADAVVSTAEATQLTDKTFDEKVFARRGAYWAVLFYDKSTYAGSQLEKDFEALALHERGKINIGAIEKSVGPNTFKRLNVKSTPAFYVFRAGRMYDFQQTTFKLSSAEDLITFAEGGYETAKGPEEVKPAKPLRPEGTEDEPEDPNSIVQILTDQDFDEKTGAIKGNKGIWFVEFYTPWCGHCKALKPIWEEVAVNLREKMTVAKIDCSVHKNTTERFGIPGFPTLLQFREGKFYRYNGERRVAEDITKWAITGWQEQDGAFVPPPLGQEMPPATWAEEFAGLKEAIQSIFEHKPWGAQTLAAAGAILGFGTVSYVYLISWVISFSKKGPAATAASAKAKAIKKKRN